MAKTNLRYIDVANATQLDARVSQLLTEGYIVQRETPAEVQLVKPKHFGPSEWVAVMFGFMCFVIPAFVYFAMWSAKPAPIVIVRVKALEPRTP